MNFQRDANDAWDILQETTQLAIGKKINSHYTHTYTNTLNL